MIEIVRRGIKHEEVDQYFISLKNELEFIVSRNLLNKTEAGLNRSEKGYQLVAASTCERMARIMGCNEDKAKALSLAVGLYFPKYGHEGIKVIKEYITNNNIDLDLNTLPIITICYCISPYHHIVGDVIYNLLCDYYNGIDSSEEIKIVRLVQETIIDIKKAEDFYNGNPGELLFNVTEDLITLISEHKVLIKSQLLDEYHNQIKSKSFPSLTKQQYEDIYNDLEQYITDFTHHSTELENFNKTKEEAIVIYIYQG